MKLSRESQLFFLCGILHLVSFLIFLKGFLPMKITSPEYAVLDDNKFDIDEDCSGATNDENAQKCSVPQVFDRFVFVLIDAFRSDFVFGDITKKREYRMKFVQNLLESKKALGLIGKAQPPTVTLPRVKAITTGTVPGFVDVIFNLDSRILAEDNLVYQLKNRGWKLLFYGDETWLRLFPGHFIRSEGISTFFIKDYTEVDNNVTRNINAELSRGDWDSMFLHYPGLDHIGHLAGPFSELVGPKLKEMDDIIHRIYQNVEGQDAARNSSTLMVVCGDHGMSDLGSHGGTSAHETSTAVVFMSPKLHYGLGRFEEVNQIDLAPTLSLLLGIPIPTNNLGTLIPSALEPLGPEERLRAAYVSAKQLTKIVKYSVDNLLKHPGYEELELSISLHSDWLKRWRDSAPDDSLLGSADEIMSHYMSSLGDMRDELVKCQSRYHLQAMISAIIMQIIVFVCLLVKMTQPRIESSMNEPNCTTSLIAIAGVGLFLFHVILTSAYDDNQSSFNVISIIISVATSFTFIVLFSCILHPHTSKTKNKNSLSSLLFTGSPLTVMLRVFLLFGVVIHVISLMSSSFVEEGHQTWYFLSTSLLLLLIIGSFLEKFKQRINSELSLKSSAGVDKESYLRKTSTTCTESDRTKSKKNCSDLNIREFVLSAVVCLVLGRLGRTLNQTGDKWSHLPDIGDWLIREDNKSILSAVNVISLLFLVLMVRVRNCDVVLQTFYLAGVLFVYCHQAAQDFVYLEPFYHNNVSTTGNPEALLVYFMIFLMCLYTTLSFIRSYCASQKPRIDSLCTKQPSVSSTTSTQLNTSTKLDSTKENCDKKVTSTSVNNKRKNSDPPGFDVVLREILVGSTEEQDDIGCISELWKNSMMIFSLLMLLLGRSHNTVLVLIINLQSYFMVKLLKYLTRCGVSPALLTVVTVWMGQAAFFYQGNSNSLATVDQAAGYKGLDKYYLIPVASMVLMNQYSGLIYWTLCLLHVLASTAHSLYQYIDSVKRSVHVMLLMRAFLCSSYFLLSTLQRYHLFVWTVFTPKLLYEGTYAVVMLCVLLCITLWNCLFSFLHVYDCPICHKVCSCRSTELV